ncbi:MAG: MBL fold metallo-hydrolase [Acidobacteria bacterium]|nr:MBL fold metallo-hydrolase [Acidobacteriota bacterium]
MRVVVLGTGTPNNDPERSGPATAIVVGDMAYLIDAGPGVVRRAAEATAAHGLRGLVPSQLGKVFITHLHSDHTLGLPDVMLGNWVLDRMFPIDVYGPPGTKELTDGIVSAWAIDLDIRMNGPEPHNEPHYRAITTEIEPGEIYSDEHVTVEAIPVPHANWPHAYGYKFTGGGRTIVISGDTKPAESLVAACSGCDVLVHEVYSAEAWERRTPDWQAYHADAHTSTIELAEIARRAQPKLLVLYHQLYWGASDDDLLREIREAGYEGDVVSARDLDIY